MTKSLAKPEPRYESIETVKLYPKPDGFSPVDDYPLAHHWYGAGRCTAWNRRQNRQCMGLAMGSTTKCRVHGGKSPKGISVHHFKDGTSSRYMPDRLIPMYLEAAEDKDLLSQRRDIALLEARIDDVLSRVDSGESGRIWKSAIRAFADMRLAIGRSDAVATQEAIAELDTYLTRGLSDWSAWSEITRLLDQRRKHIESERKRLIDMKNMISAEQSVANARALAMAVRSVIKDPKQLSEIQSEFTRQMGAGSK